MSIKTSQVPNPNVPAIKLHTLTPKSTLSVHLHRSITQVEPQLHAKPMLSSPLGLSRFLYIRYVIAMFGPHSSNIESTIMVRTHGTEVYTNRRLTCTGHSSFFKGREFGLVHNTLIESEGELAQTRQCLRISLLIFLFHVTVHSIVQNADPVCTASMTVS